MMNAITRHALVHNSPTKRSNDVIALLERLDHAYGPDPDQTRKLVVLDSTPSPVPSLTESCLVQAPGRSIPKCQSGLRYSRPLVLSSCGHAYRHQERPR